MERQGSATPAYVIKAEELAALNYISPDHPRPLLIEWIDRGTDRPLRPSTVAQLLRTRESDDASPSVSRLHHAAGLRAVFETGPERDRFATAFVAAKARLSVRKQYQVAAVFDSLAEAEHVVAELKRAGIAEESISLLWRAKENPGENGGDGIGHSRASVAAATTGAGLAGVMLGIGILALIPGFGAIAAAGAIASTIPAVAALSGIFGATGGAIARMLTDIDVDGTIAGYYEAQIRLGRVFLAVDTRVAEGQAALAKDIILANGGRKPKQA